MVGRQLYESSLAKPLYTCTCGVAYCSDEPERAWSAEERGMCDECVAETNAESAPTQHRESVTLAHVHP